MDAATIYIEGVVMGLTETSRENPEGKRLPPILGFNVDFMVRKFSDAGSSVESLRIKVENPPPDLHLAIGETVKLPIQVSVIGLGAKLYAKYLPQDVAANTRAVGRAARSPDVGSRMGSMTSTPSDGLKVAASKG
jgi:hypothetical protein